MWSVLLGLLVSVEAAEPPPVRAALSGLELRMAPDTPETTATLTATVQVYASGFVDLPLGMQELILSEATLNGRPIALPPDPQRGRRLVQLLPAGRYTLEARGLLVTPSPEATLSMPPGSPATLTLDAVGLDVSVGGGVPTGDGELALVPQETLSLRWKPEAPPAPRPGRLLAEAAVGLQVDTNGAEGRAVVRYQALNQPVSSVRLRTAGPVDAFEVSGPVVRAARQEPGAIVVDLVEPVVGPFAFEVAFRAPPTRGPAALIVPEADRVSGWVSLHANTSGAGFLERSAQGMALVSPQALPLWGQDLAPGTLLAAWEYEGRPPSLSVHAQQWEALDSPGTFIDEAVIDVATAAHGRALTRARLSVRNDRSQHLRIRLPAGSRLLVTRVAGLPVEVTRDGDHIQVPLEKSVETLQGLVAFPVEVTYFSPMPDWQRRGEATLIAPEIDAPVSLLRWEVTLPPGVDARSTEGDARLVSGEEDEAEEATPPERIAEETSVELWSSAYSAYKKNDFEEANELLEESLRYDSSNTAAQALLGNVMVLRGEEDEEDEQTRRIKAMARARSQGDVMEQSNLIDDANDALRAGDLDLAISQYSSALDVTESLAQLEDQDAYVQKAQARELEQQLRFATIERDKRRAESARNSLLGPQLDSGQDDPNVPGTLTVQVVDDSGLPVPGATVSVGPNARGSEATAVSQSNANGDVAFSALAPGRYSVTVSRAGFTAQTRFDVRVRSAQSASLGITIAPESYEEIVVMDMESQDRGEVLSREYLQRIPVGRSYQSAVQMAAGVTRSRRRQQNAGEIGWVPMQLGNRRGRKQKGAQPPPPPTIENTPTVEAMDLAGVSASEWLVFVPRAGQTLQFERQLLPASAQTVARIRYRPATPEATDIDTGAFVTQGDRDF